MSAAGGYTGTQDAEQSVSLRAAAVRMAQPTQNEAQSGLHQATRAAQHHQGGQPWPIDYEGWEDIAAPPTSDRLVSESGGAIIWQVKIGDKFGCGLWVDVAPYFSNAMEVSFQTHKNIVTAEEHFGRWAMDPVQMEQTNTETKKCRPMRRIVVTNDRETCSGPEPTYYAP